MVRLWFVDCGLRIERIHAWPCKSLNEGVGGLD
jgi:hypothetical protein